MHGDRIGPVGCPRADRQDTETVDVNGRLSWQFTDNQKLPFWCAILYDDEQDSEYGPDYGTGLAVLFWCGADFKCCKRFRSRYSAKNQTFESLICNMSIKIY